LGDATAAVPAASGPGMGPGGGSGGRWAGAGEATVEAAVRHQLATALGGRRGVLESALPTLIFTVTYVTTDELRLALALAAASALALLAVRVVQRSSVQFVLNSLVGIALAAAFALRSGRAEDAFLPGIIYNAGYATVMVVSIALRWPIVGFMIGSVMGDPTGWRSEPAVVRLCSRLTWLLLLPCLIRVAVQLPLYLTGTVGWLGASKIALGWPLQVLALAAAAALLARGRTPLHPTPPHPPPPPPPPPPR
jgi:hypothetical protein